MTSVSYLGMELVLRLIFSELLSRAEVPNASNGKPDNTSGDASGGHETGSENEEWNSQQGVVAVKRGEQCLGN